MYYHPLSNDPNFSSSHRAKEKAAAQKEATSEGGSEAQLEADAAQEMSKLNTARVRKAIDPKILEVKRRVRQARRSLKRESKVQLSDEIIFFDDVAGNEQVPLVGWQSIFGSLL